MEMGMADDGEVNKYASAIIAAIEGVEPGALRQVPALEALQIVFAMTAIAGDRTWTDEGAMMLGESHGRGMTKTLLGMLSLRQKGAVLPFDRLEVSRV